VEGGGIAGPETWAKRYLLQIAEEIVEGHAITLGPPDCSRFPPPAAAIPIETPAPGALRRWKAVPLLGGSASVDDSQLASDAVSSKCLPGSVVRSAPA